MQLMKTFFFLVFQQNNRPPFFPANPNRVMRRNRVAEKARRDHMARRGVGPSPGSGMVVDQVGDVKDVVEETVPEQEVMKKPKKDDEVCLKKKELGPIVELVELFYLVCLWIC